MTEAEYRSARARVLAGGDPPRELIEDCRRSVRLLVRTAGLPAHYSPLGVWSDEAVDEVFADWVARRLVERGQLLAMLQRAPALSVFRRMSETSVRQHLIDGLKRSQSANVYDRVARLLADDEKFSAAGSGTGRLWRVAGGPADPFGGDDRQLLAVAWSLGEFEVIRYNIAARKLSPLLEADELERFVGGLLQAGTMTTATIMHAIRLRFAVEDPVADEELDSAARATSEGDPEEEAIIGELVIATLAELTSRQAQVLIGINNEVPGREMAMQLGCSTGTISFERSQIAAILARLGTDAPKVLNRLLDALFIENG